MFRRWKMLLLLFPALLWACPGSVPPATSPAPDASTLDYKAPPPPCPPLRACDDGLCCSEDQACFRGECRDLVELAGRMALGQDHSCALDPDNRVWCWGRLSGPEVPDYMPLHSVPVPVADGPVGEAVVLSAGRYQTCAASVDGTVRCWGYDDMSGEPRYKEDDVGAFPSSVHSMQNTTWGACCLSDGDGAVWCWGPDAPSWLSGKPDDAESKPGGLLLLRGFDAVRQVVFVWGLGICGLDRSGTMRCTRNLVPSPVEYLEASTHMLPGFPRDLRFLTSPEYHDVLVATTRSGQLWFAYVNWWGDGNNDGPEEEETVEQGRIELPDGFRAATAGLLEYGLCVLTEDAEVWCSPEGVCAQSRDWHKMEPLPPIVALASRPGTAGHACALSREGDVWCWGDNEWGQLGNGTTGSMPWAVELPGLENVATVRVGPDGACARTAEGEAWCWGSRVPADGVPSKESVYVPTPLTAAGFSTVEDLAPGSERTCALAPGGTVWCWGDYDGGETVHALELPEPAVALFGKAARICAADASGTVHCWGGGGGCPGTSEADLETPVSVWTDVPPAAVVALDGGMCVLLPGGDVYCRGEDLAPPPSGPSPGMLGCESVRIEVPPAVQLVGDARRACILTADSEIWCWGKGGTAWDAHFADEGFGPLQIEAATQVLSIALGRASLCALHGDGSVGCLGRGDSGQLGGGTTVEESETFVDVVDADGNKLTDVTQLDCADESCCAVRSDGKVLCWGANGAGELGIGRTARSDTPVLVHIGK